jgi:hypothetical protein
MCFAPKMPAMPPIPPPPAPPPPPLPTAEKAVTTRQARPQQKRRRGTAQLTARRPSVGMGGGSGGTGVQLSQ